MSTTVSYKGETLTTVSNATKTLQTEGKYLEDDITLVDVSGGGATLITKNISANGTYNASSDSADGYSQVNVSVPNTYSAGDEGKVVSNGALVAQTSDTVTTNDTYDTTLINSLTVNVSGGGGGEISDILARTATSLNLPGITTLGADVFYKYSALTAVTMPNVVTIGNEAFRECTNLASVFFASLIQVPATAFYGCSKLTQPRFPSLKTVKGFSFYGCNKMPYIVIPASGGTIESNAFQACSLLENVDFAGNTIEGAVFASCTALDTIVLRRTNNVVTLWNINSFSSTPFASGGAGGTIYVPSSLISSYQSASNWSTILGYANNSIKSIESTHTDPTAPFDMTLYYADGTPLPTT